jgi:peptidoglycan/LPS O-acetylase OafA/YrhL
MDLGVKVFFGISGFILSIPFLKSHWFIGRQVNLKEYFIRRLTRLEPPFIVAITGFLIVHWIVLGENLSTLIPYFAATLLYVHILIYNAYFTILPVTWSLETEV